MDYFLVIVLTTTSCLRDMINALIFKHCIIMWRHCKLVRERKRSLLDAVIFVLKQGCGYRLHSMDGAISRRF